MKYTQQQALRLRKWADLLAYMIAVSNKDRGMRVVTRYRLFIERLNRERWNA